MKKLSEWQTENLGHVVAAHGMDAVIDALYVVASNRRHNAAFRRDGHAYGEWSRWERVLEAALCEDSED